MRITQLKHIVAVAQQGSINKAAQELDISQPALSASLRELENELELSLFQRTRRGVAPTAEGEKIIEEARLILESVDRINHITEAADVRPEIKVATGAFFEFMIPDIIAAYQKKWPNILLHFFPMDNLNNVLDDIAKEHYRFCLCCFSREELDILHEIKRLKEHILFENIEISAIMHKNHPYANNAVITPEHLITEQLIMPDSPLTSYYFEVFPQLKNACKAITTDLYSALQLVQNNNSITIQNTLSTINNPYRRNFPDIVAVPYRNGIDTAFHAMLIAPKIAYLSKAENDFLDVVKEISKRFVI